MKPTRGRVSLGSAGKGWLGLVVIGALARSVADSALMLDVMQGSLLGDRSPAPPIHGRFVEAAARAPEKLRIAFSHRIPPGVVARISHDQRLAFERISRLLAELGHELSERHPRYGSAALELTQTGLRVVHEMHAELPDPARAEPCSRQLSAAGRLLVPPSRRNALLAKRARTATRIMSLWDESDVLLTPGLARTALPAEGAFGRSAPVAFQIATGFTPWTPFFNLTGQPAITVPAGIGSDGLPLSVQLVGRLGAEDLLFSLAAQIESAQPWSHLRPEIS
jgi:amidase